MKLSKRFKVGVFSWVVLSSCFLSNNLWIQFIAIELLIILLIYDGYLTKKSKNIQLLRGVILLIFGLTILINFLPKLYKS